jgi:hypothetical protein
MSESRTGQNRVKRTYFRGYGCSGVRISSRVVRLVGLASLALISACFEAGDSDSDLTVASWSETRGRGQLQGIAAGIDGRDCEEQLYDERSYLFCADRYKWEEAQEACAARGYHLLAIADAEEEAWIYAQLADEPRVESSRQGGERGPGARLNPNDPRYQWWMGFNDRDEEGSWTWEDGSPVTYVNWHRDGTRRDIPGKDCARLNRFAPATGWYDTPCSTKARFICEEGGGQVEEPVPWHADADGDGYGDPDAWVLEIEAPSGYVAAGLATDCDDGDEDVFPGADERCNETDDDCDGLVDNAALDALAWYADGDMDGYGDALRVTEACQPPTGFVADASDCDDGDAAVSPAGLELCDGLDNDCDGSIDLDAADAPTWYADADGDSYGDAAASSAACTAPTGFVADASDCDDGDAAVSPAGLELCDGIDNDCDGSVDLDAADAPTWYADADGDSYGDAAATTTACSCPGGYVATPDDCDDSVVSGAPMGPELCDGLDNDCDGVIDEDDAIDASRWWRDADADGYGDADISALSCYIIPDYVHNDLDCDDSVAVSNPGAPELCDGLDNDCDGSVDDAPIDSLAWYADVDGDGFGAASSFVAACEQPDGHVLIDGDCDDASAGVNPDASERCNGADDDCDGSVDDDPVDGDTFHVDIDGDGYGGPSGTTVACELPLGYADNDDDCNDGAAAFHPGATEWCNGFDDDCDGTVDVDAQDSPTWYPDADGDGWGTSRDAQVICEAPSGYVAAAGDCDDADAAVSPDADEACNGRDDDCDGERDEDDAIDAATWYLDADADGYGVATETTRACSAPAGWASPDVGEDCDDGVDSVHPGAVESCNGLDDDCDGSVDEEPGEGPLWYLDADSDGHGDPASSVVACSAPDGYASSGDDCDDADGGSWHGPAWYADADGDGYGDATVSSFGCTAPVGFVASADDCDDSQRTINPGVAERCNGLDDDCDGEADEAASDALTFYADADGDGYGDPSSPGVGCEAAAGQVDDASDCDDSDADSHPGADERCDGHDDDCDGVVDEPDAVDAPSWYRDADTDGWGDPELSTAACSEPDGYVALDFASDCDDADGAVHPGADEACNGADDDCDGAVDEDDARDAIAWYLDSDGDGYGNPSAEQLSCDPVSGHVDNAGDCNDADADVRPGVDEVCNGADDDCDGERDEDAIDMAVFYLDEDGDGFGVDTLRWACDAEEGWAATAGDCDDDDDAVSPEADELCNGSDDDCDGITDEDDAVDATAWYVDADADGWGSGSVRVACLAMSGEVERDGDCDDDSVAINPEASERCDGVDEDCDGLVDEGALDAATWSRDSDGDGWGDASRSEQACEQPAGTSAQPGDCDDGSVDALPGGIEICDGIDNDCDGGVDVGAIDQATWYRDGDGDGWGTPADVVASCEAPSGYVGVPGDCDDSEPSGPPGEEYCDGFDNDCDGVVDEPESVDASWWYRDRDADGHGDLETTALACYQPYEFVLDASDCDDDNAARYPGNIEICDGLDNDCDVEVDEDAVGRVTWYEDGDMDGFGDPATASLTCEAPEGWLTDGSDCDDADPARNPSASEVCNAADDDCDGSTDEDAVDALTWFLDADLDGFGVPEPTTASCDLPLGWSATADDCDDASAAAYPGATEICDGLDNDCDAETDEADAADAVRWYQDLDGDSFGDASTGTDGCTQPAGWVALADDCDDADADVNPAAIEGCNGADDDCDGAVDEGAVDAASWYLDSDSDGFGDAGEERRACEQPSGHVADATDCDDGSDEVHPLAAELCNSADDDCDGLVDNDAIDGRTWYQDADSDGWGVDSASSYACQRPDGYVADAGDCDDTVAAAHPGANEICDGLDNDCDAVADEDDALDARPWYMDSDGDGYGLAGTGHVSCEAPSGYVASRFDCDDASAWVHPDATELCNGIDDDCDDVIDLDSDEIIAQWVDADGDGWGARGEALQACELQPGYVTQRGDCDDTAATSNPDAPELCDSLDNDCDTLVDEADAIDSRTWHRDRDGDGYGSATTTTESCAMPEGYVSNGLDCDDGESTTNPDAIDTCKDGVDNDCDGLTDDCTGWPEEAVLSAAEAVLVGESSASKVGNALAALGDLDGDGLGELAVGAWMDDGSARNAGAVYIVDGPLWGETSLDSARAKLSGELASDSAGYAIDAGGDVNGDGHADLIIGAHGHDANGSSAGIAYLVHGPVNGDMGLASADARLLGLAEDDRAGAAVAGVGDVNGDGRDDLLVGAYGDSSAGSSAGAAYLFYGPVSGTAALSTADAQLLGAASKDFAGTAVAGVGDSDGDGYDDMAVGAWGQDGAGSGAGAVHVVLGPVYGQIDLAQADATLWGGARGDKFGASLAAAGDLDGDGYGDLLVGAEGEDGGGDLAGAAYLFYGPLDDGISALEADMIMVGAGRDEKAGSSVAVAGDLDGDGWTDLVVGAPGASVSGNASGAAYLVFSAGVGTVDLATDALCFAGEASSDNAGLAVAGPGDMDGDGLDDLAVGAEGADRNGDQSGAVYLLTGMLGAY